MKISLLLLLLSISASTYAVEVIQLGSSQSSSNRKDVQSNKNSFALQKTANVFGSFDRYSSHEKAVVIGDRLYTFDSKVIVYLSKLQTGSLSNIPMGAIVSAYAEYPDSYKPGVISKVWLEFPEGLTDSNIEQVEARRSAVKVYR